MSDRIKELEVENSILKEHLQALQNSRKPKKHKNNFYQHYFR